MKEFQEGLSINVIRVRSRDEITKEVIEQVAKELDTAPKDYWSQDVLQEIEEKAKRKIEGLDSQTQSIGHVLTALGILSLTALVISEQQVQQLFAAFDSMLARITGGQAGGSIGSIILVPIILGLFIIIASSFSLRSHRDLFALNVTREICAFRREDNGAQPVTRIEANTATAVSPSQQAECVEVFNLRVCVRVPRWKRQRHGQAQLTADDAKVKDN